jgi:hypothetical protein
MSTKSKVNKSMVLRNLKNDTYARLGCTKYGVGLVAIKEIPAGADIFKTTIGPCKADEWVKLSPAQIKTLPKPIQELVYDFGAVRGGPLAKSGPAVVPLLGMNTLDVTNYFNHSDKPNCKAMMDPKCFMRFKSLRKIKVGEELTYKYQ